MQKSLSIFLLTQDRFTYVGLQRQEIPIFRHSYYEPPSIAVWVFWCYMWFISTQRSSFPWPFWILILSLDMSAIPHPSEMLPSSSQSGSPISHCKPGFVPWAWFCLLGVPCIVLGPVLRALLIRKEFLGWRFVTCDCQGPLCITLLKPWCDASPLSSHNVPHSHTNINEHAPNMLCNSVNEGLGGW